MVTCVYRGCGKPVHATDCGLTRSESPALEGDTEVFCSTTCVMYFEHMELQAIADGVEGGGPDRGHDQRVRRAAAPVSFGQPWWVRGAGASGATAGPIAGVGAGSATAAKPKKARAMPPIKLNNGGKLYPMLASEVSVGLQLYARYMGTVAGNTEHYLAKVCTSWFSLSCINAPPHYFCPLNAAPLPFGMCTVSLIR